MKKSQSRYERIKKFSEREMAEFLSWYFNCSSCPAKMDNCSDNDAMCMDAIYCWLNNDGDL